MRVLLSTYGSRGCVEPLVGRAVPLRALGAELLAHVGVPLVPLGQPVRSLVYRATSLPAADLPRRAAALVAAVAEGCDPLVMRSVMPVGGWR